MQARRELTHMKSHALRVAFGALSMLEVNALRTQAMRVREGYAA
ncbi:hypothetical protein PAMC26510_32315 [Caballeronia sordidicola]|uniref:Uncharacterized protein n=1 Tax=Caballeronia sordidicola TaxID=196367 RepID=A0A242M8X0_CABSO|nr:hypothetical protein PAMC26510_32315 [Caballeronia sordidicola]